VPVADFGAPDVPCPLQLPLHPPFAKLTNPTPNLLAAAFRLGKLGRHATTEFENSSSDVRDRVWYTRTSGSYQSHTHTTLRLPTFHCDLNQQLKSTTQSFFDLCLYQIVIHFSRHSHYTDHAVYPYSVRSLGLTILQTSTFRCMNGPRYQPAYSELPAI
jgi:hypothetical protein